MPVQSGTVVYRAVHVSCLPLGKAFAAFCVRVLLSTIAAIVSTARAMPRVVILAVSTTLLSDLVAINSNSTMLFLPVDKNKKRERLLLRKIPYESNWRISITVRVNGSHAVMKDAACDGNANSGQLSCYFYFSFHCAVGTADPRDRQYRYFEKTWFVSRVGFPVPSDFFDHRGSLYPAGSSSCISPCWACPDRIFVNGKKKTNDKRMNKTRRKAIKENKT